MVWDVCLNEESLPLYLAPLFVVDGVTRSRDYADEKTLRTKCDSLNFLRYVVI